MSHSEPATEQSHRLPLTRPTKGSDAARAWLIGLLAGVLGLSPWWITGARLPLQNLWATQVWPDHMPLALLPLSQYELTTIVALLTVGGAAAGLSIRIWSPARRRLVTWCGVGGVFTVQLVATIQSFSVLHQGLAPGSMSSLYFGGLLAGVIGSMVAALVALVLISSRSTVKATIGCGLMAVPLTSWAVEWVVGVMGYINVPTAVPSIARWVPAILAGCALAWCGFLPARRLVAWVLNLAFLWVIPALFTSVQYVLGTRVSAGDLPEMLLMSRQILAATLGPDGGALPTLLLAVVIGLLGVGVRAVVSRRRSRQGVDSTGLAADS
ncbi:hypothetical protein [Paenarthrobacter aurescens]|uniref:Uncharacterized protein n=1 Tax=Paenarthrobacter aurescens TaxID=43663 RepID=A0A4Y3N7F3_PAEAU|nr:hypothetical protein [Paenarthrobacter aurescens]MDO6144869.1 hypothetical protein [Paenarthrobacter aurescens]MDO6148714.1 hypothetical protein [Paenarthrobacter aurescens]MDO6159960.1 hypothetical protein [Paenarthrobacter aurescens]MDO6163819.1 hypothetical protein [Paenarthrobacter aurescens]GEB17472.1 hypothetical protein AAU01_02270 [Paenarthrobacter aurescens]